VTISPATNEDEPQLRLFLEGLCEDARRLRFFTGATDIATAAHLTATVDERHLGLIAHDAAGVLVGHAICIQLDDERAEVAVEVADRLHGCGLGTVLVERLAAIAQERGIERLVAEVLPDNQAMLDVFRDGFDARLTFHDGVEAVVFATAAWRLARERFDDDTGAGAVEKGGEAGAGAVGESGLAAQPPPVLINPRSSA
jgi:ribosomal protein S18 acetylase RimI-like enzyme